jgi:hypothetical protein
MASIEDQLRVCGLSPQEIDFHQKMILKKDSSFFIEDTCRIDNKRIIPLPALQHPITGIWAFVPAAGAASRFNAEDCPKAFFPCVEEGTSFLEMKCFEHEALGCLGGQIYAVPRGFKDAFVKKIRSILPTHCVEQGPDLSTVRFLESGEIYLDSFGQISLVPKGHGALATLFPSFKTIMGGDHSLFIRNIDNVGGIGEEFVSETKKFFAFHNFILEQLNGLRPIFRDEPKSLLIPKIIDRITKICPPRDLNREEVAEVESKPVFERPIWTLLCAVFHLPIFMVNTHQLVDLLNRPLQTMGMVPNSGHDIGGSPVVVQTPRGPMSLCIEGSHVLSSQRETILVDPQKNTHFNPVFLCSELSSNQTHYDDNEGLFSIVAKKTWKEQKVVYFESLLYELLGNGIKANLLFVQVPRSVFNPHKTLEDTLGKTMAYWGFHL